MQVKKNKKDFYIKCIFDIFLLHRKYISNEIVIKLSSTYPIDNIIELFTLRMMSLLSF